MPFEGTTTYAYQTPQSLSWTGNETVASGTSGATNATAFRKQINWGTGQNISNRIGIYFVGDPENIVKLRVFLESRANLPAGATGSINVDQPIMTEIDNNNRRTELFFIGSTSDLYVEPAQWNGAGGAAFDPPLKLTVFQAVGKPVKYFGL